MLRSSVIFAVLIAAIAGCSRRQPPTQYNTVSSQPRIKPDYSGILIPPNIAPMNFHIIEDADSVCVTVRNDDGEEFTVHSRSNSIKFPPRQWKQLLAASKGQKIHLDIYVKKANSWTKFKPIVNSVANEDIDPVLAYRFIPPIHNWWKDIALYQRNLETFNATPILFGKDFTNGCTNCHSFTSNSPQSMSIAIRSRQFGSSSIVISDRNIQKVNTKWGYTAWHPSGKIAAYSTNKVIQFFHSRGTEIRDVADLDSAILYYNTETQNVKTTPALSDKDRLETYPTWSPDGKYLYYCSAPILWKDRNSVPPKNYKQLKYSLMRIGYDIQTDAWGQPETILSSETTQKSILLPRISPNGKHLVFCMCQYGCFPIYQTSSDLYIMNTDTLEYSPLTPANSPYSESWHSFSSNSRWLAFSSRKNGGVLTRIWFTYINENGEASKPFLLPQEQPDYYDSLTKVFSVPELITAPVDISHKTIAQIARATGDIDVKLPISGATRKALSSDPWKQRE